MVGQERDPGNDVDRQRAVRRRRANQPIECHVTGLCWVTYGAAISGRCVECNGKVPVGVPGKDCLLGA
jgi:hypothetical protein